MELPEAISLVSRAFSEGSVPGGYLVVGDVNGNAREFVMKILCELFTSEAEIQQIRDMCHPDVAFLCPEGASRTIKTDTVREKLVEPMTKTSYSGGWKVGVVFGADRMQISAANVFLKSLEEPSPKTVYFLLTDNPTQLLPTIVSRCQRIDLKVSEGVLEDGPEREAIDEVFSSSEMSGVFARAQAAKYLASVLDDLKKNAPKGESAIVKKAFYKTIMRQVREWMARGLVPLKFAFRNIEAVEEAYARSERFISDESVLSFMMDKLVFPKR
ncbi:MAG: hypothetical protein IJQ34_04150 [Kiritimatiellae bacterium]|nr:hypothetical protein [Kiritimatiellia bacterium]